MFGKWISRARKHSRTIDRLKQAIESFSELYESESDVYLSPLSINKLHEFLTLEDAEASDTYELRKVYA